jgi:hypothetical protein
MVTALLGNWRNCESDQIANVCPQLQRKPGNFAELRSRLAPRSSTACMSALRGAGETNMYDWLADYVLRDP